MAQREERLQRDRERRRERRVAETPSEREERLQRDRERRREKTAAETPSEREERLQRDRERSHARRAAESTEETEARLRRVRDRRAAETPEQREVHECRPVEPSADDGERLRRTEGSLLDQAWVQELMSAQRDRERRRKRRAAETPSEREERLQRDRERWRERRVAETPSEREKRLRRERERRAAESTEEREARLRRRRDRRAAETPEQREVHECRPVEPSADDGERLRQTEGPLLDQAWVQERMSVFHSKMASTLVYCMSVITGCGLNANIVAAHMFMA